MSPIPMHLQYLAAAGRPPSTKSFLNDFETSNDAALLIMRYTFFLAFLFVGSIQGFSTQRIGLPHPLKHTKLYPKRFIQLLDSNSNIGGSCPFSKSFPKYRIDFTRLDRKEKSGFSLPLLGGLKKSFGKREMEEKLKPARIQWLEDEISNISIFIQLWDSAAQLHTSTEDRVVVGATDAASQDLVQRWYDIFSWMQSEKSLENLKNNVKIDATIHNEGSLVAIELVRRGEPQLADAASQTYNPETLDRRTQAWVQRILVEQGTTKSDY